MKKVILVLDKEEYKKQEEDIINVFKKNNLDVEIKYTKYEDTLIRKVRNVKVLGSLLQHILYWIKSFNYALNINKDKENKKILCVNPIVGIFLGLLNKNKKREIILCGFLFENKKNKLYYALRKKITEKVLKNIKYAVVYGSKEVALYEKMFGMKDKFKFVKYGIDYDGNQSYTKNLPNDFIFSGGGSNRDYKTLIESYNSFDRRKDIPLYIATKRTCLENINVDNVTILTDVVLENFGDVLRKSKFIVLSLKDEDISVGHQVLLQSLKENAVILINKIQAIEDYVNSEQVIFFETCNKEDLKQKMEYILDNYDMLKEKYSNNSKYYYENYTFNSMLNRIINL